VASCSSTGRVAFKAELLRQPARLRGESVGDELLHLKVPNHAQLLRTLLRRQLAALGKQPE
jgi:predicted metal-dependent hydrolase